jgi:GcrA cell cycle regulator
VNVKGSAWTEERIEKLKALHARKLSCSMMASELGGVTRNAVIGKLHRLGLSNAYSTVHRDNQYGRKPRPKKENRKTIRIVRANGNSNQHRVMESAETDLAALRCVEVIPQHIALLDIQPHHCRYPYGESPFTFCGHTILDGRSYCGPHYALSIRAPRPISPAVQEQRRRTLRANYKLALVEVA